MEKFKELNYEEVLSLSGGSFVLWSPSVIVTEFVIGISETFSDSFARYRQEIKYEK